MLRALKRLLSPPVRRRLDLPPTPAPPPPFLGGGPWSGRSGQLKAYTGWVFAAVNLIARRAAGVPLRLYAGGEAASGAEIERHPVLDLLRRPNPIHTRRQLRFTLVTHLELTGMAFLLKVESALRRPAELWPLSPADLVEIQAGPDTRRPIAGFRFNTPEGQKVYPPESIVYLRHPSPVSLLYGASPIAAAAHAIDIDLAVRIYQRNFFKNSARPEIVLSTDQRLSEDEARRILTRWNQKHQGLAHAFEPTVLDGGLTAQPITYSAKDFEFLALAGWTQDNILAAYGVPAGKLGLVKDLNRANAFAVDVTFNSECIKPRLDLIEDALNAWLLPAWGGELALRHDNPVPTDREQTHREAVELLDRGAITINEHRAALGRPPVPWGDQPHWPTPAAPALPEPPPAWEPPASEGPGSGDEEASSNSSNKLDPALTEAAAGLIRRHYPRLEARFAGWSRPRVARELAQHPELVNAMLPAGLGQERAARLGARLGGCLEGGRGLGAALEAIGD